MPISGDDKTVAGLVSSSIQCHRMRRILPCFGVGLSFTVTNLGSSPLGDGSSLRPAAVVFGNPGALAEVQKKSRKPFAIGNVLSVIRSSAPSPLEMSHGPNKPEYLFPRRAQVPRSEQSVYERTVRSDLAATSALVVFQLSFVRRQVVPVSPALK